MELSWLQTTTLTVYSGAGAGGVSTRLDFGPLVSDPDRKLEMASTGLQWWRIRSVYKHQLLSASSHG